MIAANSASLLTTGSNLATFARKGASAGDVPGGLFTAFRDPVAGTGGTAAFAATLATNAVAGINAANNSGLWWHRTGALNLLARKGSHPLEGPAGAKWSAFSQLALPDFGTSPLFVASMVNRTANPVAPALPGPNRVVPTTDTGLRDIDSAGTLRLLVREGDLIGGKAVRTFTVLSVVPGSSAQKRSFNDQGAVIFRAANTGGSQSIIQVLLASFFAPWRLRVISCGECVSHRALQFSQGNLTAAPSLPLSPSPGPANRQASPDAR